MEHTNENVQQAFGYINTMFQKENLVGDIEMVTVVTEMVEIFQGQCVE